MNTLKTICSWTSPNPSQQTHTHLLQYIHAQLPPTPLQLLHSVDYFQHNKIWGRSGSKSWSPLVYFCDGILIHSQRLRIAVAWHRLLHLALDTELEAAPTCSKSSRPTGREQVRGRERVSCIVLGCLLPLCPPLPLHHNLLLVLQRLI